MILNGFELQREVRRQLLEEYEIVEKENWKRRRKEAIESFDVRDD